MSETPISLYFGVPEGENADLEVVALATLEWTRLIRDLANLVAPEVEFDIEFVESERGSVWLTNLLKAARDGDRKALASITYAVIVFFALGPALHLQTDIGDWVWEQVGHEHAGPLSDEDKEDIARRVVQAAQTTALEGHRRQIVRYVEQDPSIGAVGVGYLPSSDGPISKIDRSDFPAMGAVDQQTKIMSAKQTDVQRSVRVTIIRASLEEGDRRPRWRFAEGETKWSADIEDEEFIFALNQDQTGLHLAVGQTLVVDVAIDRKFNDGAWQEDNRRIIRVIQPEVSRRQGALELRGE